MKKVLLSLSVAVLMISCGESHEAVQAKESNDHHAEVEHAEVGSEEITHDSFTVNAATSVVGWQGKKLAGDHHGVVNVKSGTVSIHEGSITGAEVEIDLASIKENDADAEYAAKLEGHLKSADFFDVAAFPTAKVVVTGVTNSKASADLTIKGKTKAIEFPIEATVTDSSVNVKAEFTINRTDWGIVYGSGSFMDLAKDKIIDDNISFTIEINAAK